MHASVVKSYTSGNRGVLVASAEGEVVEEAGDRELESDSGGGEASQKNTATIRVQA